ncbi:hypothetical protein [Kibdelosporangium philippinense]
MTTTVRHPRSPPPPDQDHPGHTARDHVVCFPATRSDARSDRTCTQGG